MKDNYLPSEKDGLDDLLYKNKIFDINPNTNYQLLVQSIELSNIDLEKNYYIYNQTLTFSQKTKNYKKIRKN